MKCWCQVYPTNYLTSFMHIIISWVFCLKVKTDLRITAFIVFDIWHLILMQNWYGCQLIFGPLVNWVYKSSTRNIPEKAVLSSFFLGKNTYPTVSLAVSHQCDAISCYFTYWPWFEKRLKRFKRITEHSTQPFTETCKTALSAYNRS